MDRWRTFAAVPSRTLSRAAGSLIVVTLGLALLNTSAAGAAQLHVGAALSPERLGHASTISVGYELADPPGEELQPVTAMKLSLPAGLSIATSELGLKNCQRVNLELEGAKGCPANSEIGHGTAVTEVPFGSEDVLEQVSITLFSAPLRNERPQLLVFASGDHPVIANIVFGASVEPVKRPFGSLINTVMPLVPGLPGGPDVALLSMHTTIGPAGIVYSETVAGKTVRFHPQGLTLPRRCPKGGFPFAVSLGLQDGAQASAATTVPCPTETRR